MDIQQYIASGILEQYVLDDLTEAERKTVERYAELYPEIKLELKAIEDSLEAYAALNAIEPAPQLANKLLQLIAEDIVPSLQSVILTSTEKLAFTEAAQTVVITLEAKTSRIQARAEIYWNEKKEQGYLSFATAEQNLTQVYQLWAWMGEETKCLGRLPGSAPVSVWWKIPFVEAITAFGLTLAAQSDSVSIPNHCLLWGERK